MWIKRADYQRLMSETKALIAQVEKLKNLPILVDMSREERCNTFMFARGEKTVVVRTMGLLSDDFNGWKKDLLS